MRTTPDPARMSAIRRFLLLPVLWFATVLPTPGRTWADISGNTLEADLVGVQGDTVIMEKNGVQRRFRLHQLSFGDRRYVDQQVREVQRAKSLKERGEAYRSKAAPEGPPSSSAPEVSDTTLYPKSREAMFDQLKRIHAAGEDPDVPSDHLEALRLLNAYRYLCDVPPDVGLDGDYTLKARAAAEICLQLGRLDHNPPNPGMPDEAYKIAREGASHSNLYAGSGLVNGVHSFMGDSDLSNIDRLGHRRWCLNPTMALTGFGQKGSYAAMWSMDCGRPSASVPDYDFIAFPPRGYVPVDYFRADYAWSVTLNPGRYEMPLGLTEDQIRVYPVKRSGNPADPATRSEALPLAYFKVNLDGYGIANCIIFQPEGVRLKRGNRYWVEISGLKSSRGKKAAIAYLVEFTTP